MTFTIAFCYGGDRMKTDKIINKTNCIIITLSVSRYVLLLRYIRNYKQKLREVVCSDYLTFLLKLFSLLNTHLIAA